MRKDASDTLTREDHVQFWLRGADKDFEVMASLLNIDLGVFWDKDEIDGYDEDVRLMQLTRSYGRMY